MQGLAIADGDPVYPDIFERLDYDEERARCGAPDPDLFKPVPGRYLVGYRRPPTHEDISRLGNAARVRWIYERLKLIEVETQQAEVVASMPGVAAVTPAWNTLGTTRTVAVGLNHVCAIAARQDLDEGPVYRHPAGIGYPVWTMRNGRKDLALDPDVDIPTPPALIPVVNLSLGTIAVGFPTAISDIVNFATLGASPEVLLVVAAGNCGAYGGDSMSAWARPDWVLSVGATDDPDGTRLAPYSSRGSPGPDLLAFGRSEINGDVRSGTSFAAPRVTRLAKLVVAALVQLGRAVMVAQGQDPVGVPAVGHAMVDRFGDGIWLEQPDATGLQALPLLGVDRDAVDLLVRLTGPALTVCATPQLVREVLIAAAKPVPGADTSAAGAGFVNSSIVVAHLAAITGADIWQWFGTGTSPGQEQLAALSPFVASELHDLNVIVGITGPTVKFDYKTGRWVRLPLEDERLYKQHPNGLQIDLTGIRV